MKDAVRLNILISLSVVAVGLSMMAAVLSGMRYAGVGPSSPTGFPGPPGFTGAAGTNGINGTTLRQEGQWTAQTPYVRGDLVIYNNSTYMASTSVDDSTAPPSNPSFELICNAGSCASSCTANGSFTAIPPTTMLISGFCSSSFCPTHFEKK
jgi:hypothetical protein